VSRTTSLRRKSPPPRIMWYSRTSAGDQLFEDGEGVLLLAVQAENSEETVSRNI
jgi:hypothetical protein